MAIWSATRWLTTTNQLLYLVKISRPFGWALAAWLVWIGAWLAGASNLLQLLLLLSLATFPFCLWLFGWNDIFDFPTDAQNPRKDSWIDGALVSPTDALRIRPLLTAIFGVVLLCSLLLPPWSSASLLVAFVVGFAYSHPRTRLKELPLIDGLASAIIIGALFAAGYTLGASPESIPLQAYAFIPAIIAHQQYAAVIDVEADRYAGNRTLPVRIGVSKTLWIALLLDLMPLAITGFQLHPALLLIIISQALVFLLSLIVTRVQRLLWLGLCALTFIIIISTLLMAARSWLIG